MKISDLNKQQKRTAVILLSAGVILLITLIVIAIIVLGGSGTSSPVIGSQPVGSEESTGLLSEQQAENLSGLLTDSEESVSNITDSVGGNTSVHGSASYEGTTVDSNTNTASGAGGTETAKETILVGGYSVRDFGAKGDGKTDDTSAFQAALAAAKEAKVNLYVPAGTYKLTTGLALGNVTMCGPGIHDITKEANKLPVLLISQNSANAITLSSGAINGIHIQYLSGSASKKAAIYLTGPGNRISNVKISNAYQGIVFDQISSSINPGRSNIEGVVIEGTRYMGMKVTNTYDVTYLHNVSVTGTSNEYKTAGIGIWFEKNDDVRVSDCQVMNACYGYKFTDLKKASGGDETMSTWGNFLRCKASGVSYGIHISSNFPDQRMAPIVFNDGNIQASNSTVFVEKSGGVLTMTNTALNCSGAATLNIQGGHNIMLNNCTVTASKGIGAKITGGAHILLNHNKITASSTGIEVGGYAPKGLVISDNTISASVKVQDTTTSGTIKAISGNK